MWVNVALPARLFRYTHVLTVRTALARPTSKRRHIFRNHPDELPSKVIREPLVHNRLTGCIMLLLSVFTVLLETSLDYLIDKKDRS
jgi:hypothetical protein